MNITLTIQAPELAGALQDLAGALRVLSASGNCVSELIEKGVTANQAAVQGAPGAPQPVALPATAVPIAPPAPAQPQGGQPGYLQPQPAYQPPQAPAYPQPPGYPQPGYVPMQQPQPGYAPVQQPPAPVSPPPAQHPVPTVEQSYSFDQLAVAATQLLDAGKDVFPILHAFGVSKLMDLPKEQYGAFATALRQQGAAI